MDKIPLIWTTRGNLPVADLEYSTRWEDTPDHTTLIETYRLGGEVVRESAHVLHRRGLSADGLTQTI